MIERRARILFASVFLIAVTTIVDAATIVIVNKDAAGIGFNDPTAAAPVGGNAGTTLGQQRLNVFQAAANVWGAKISSPFTIKITAQFGPLTPCGVSSGVLGSAGPTTFVRDEPGLPRAGTWYPAALASALTGTDWAVAEAVPDGASIDASFNSNVGTAGCLPSAPWYLGLDGVHGSAVDLETVLLHEFGHGLGFIGLISTSTGTVSFDGFPDIFSVFARDNSVSLYWNTMSNAQRLASMVNNGNVVFDGPNMTVAAGAIPLTVGRDGLGLTKLYVPAAIEQGSTMYHVDKTATPNQLMEPIINGNLTHNVDTPNDVTARFMQDIGWPQPAAIAAPTNVVATATTASLITVTWTAAAGATSYHVYRTNDGTTFTQQGGNIACCTLVGDAATTGKAYLYKVRSFNGSTESADSNRDLAYAFAFADPTLAAGALGTTVKAAHIAELRTAVTAVRQQLTGVLPSYTDPTLTTGATGTKIKRQHIIELRTALDAARLALSLPAISYTDSTITAFSTQVKKAHIDDLRNGVK